MNATYAVFLLRSPTRSSFVGFVPQAELDGVVAKHNAPGGPALTELCRPWAMADHIVVESAELARRCAEHVGRQSGFRARIRALDACRRGPPPAEDGFVNFYDGLTYAKIEFINPADPSRAMSVRVMVDTGATDCELRSELIEQLRLPPTGEGALFETASGITTSAPLYRATVRAFGRSATVLLSPAEHDEDESSDDDDETSNGEGRDAFDAEHGFDRVSDDGLLGHDCLAALNLAVDCRRRRLIELPWDEES